MLLKNSRPGWKSLSVTNTLAHRALLYVTKKIKCCEYGFWIITENKIVLVDKTVCEYGPRYLRKLEDSS